MGSFLALVTNKEALELIDVAKRQLNISPTEFGGCERSMVRTYVGN